MTSYSVTGMIGATSEIVRDLITNGPLLEWNPAVLAEAERSGR